MSMDAVRRRPANLPVTRRVRRAVLPIARAAGAGRRWQALVLAGVEATLVVAGSVWLLGFAQRRSANGGRLSAVHGRVSYAAFVLQAPVLLTLSIAVRSLPWAAEAKAFTVAALGVAGSFLLGRLVLCTRLGRIL